MTKLQAAIAYFEDAVQESDEIINDCSADLAAELTEQKAHFVLALEVLRCAQADDDAPGAPGWQQNFMDKFTRKE